MSDLRRLIFAACRDLGIDTDARHDLQMRVTGKASLADMTPGDHRKLLDALKAQGFRLRPAGKRPAAARPDIRYLHVLWRLLVEGGAVKERGAAGLNAFIRRRFAAHWGSVPIDVDALTDAQQINDVTRALRDMCRRAQIEVDP